MQSQEFGTNNMVQSDNLNRAEQLNNFQESRIESEIRFASSSIDLAMNGMEIVKKDKTIVLSKSSENMSDSKKSVDLIGMERKKSLGLISGRNVRQEQMVQLIAGKIREGDLLLSSYLEQTWELKKHDPSWKFCSQSRELNHSILNEITLNIEFNSVKERIINRGKSLRSNILKTEIEAISKACSINHEKMVYEGIDPQDCLTLSLEKEFRDGFFKIAEMSIEDKRCPILIGFKRNHLELRYYQIAPDRDDARCSKLYIVHCFKLKPNKDSIKDAQRAEQMNDLFIENLLKELRI